MALKFTFCMTTLISFYRKLQYHSMILYRQLSQRNDLSNDYKSTIKVIQLDWNVKELFYSLGT